MMMVLQFIWNVVSLKNVQICHGVAAVKVDPEMGKQII